MAKTKFDFENFLSARTPGEKTLGIVALVLVGGSLMYGLVVGPILSKLSVLDQETAVRREEIKRDRRILSFKDRILGEYGRSRTYLDATEKSSEEIISALLKKIETVAQDESITIKDIRPGETETKPQFQVYKTSLDCEGTLAHLLAFMNTLEQSDYLFQITRYNFSPKSKGADILKASMDVARYLIPAEKVDASFLEGFEAMAVPSEQESLTEPLADPIPEFPDLQLESESLK